MIVMMGRDTGGVFHVITEEPTVDQQTDRIDFNNEDSNRTDNPSIAQVLEKRLNRRSLFKGVGLGGAALGAASLTGCATSGSSMSAPLNALGFKPVAKRSAQRHHPGLP